MIIFPLFACLVAVAALHVALTERRARQAQAGLWARWVKYLDWRVGNHEEVISAAAELSASKIKEAQQRDEARKAGVRVGVTLVERPEEPEN